MATVSLYQITHKQIINAGRSFSLRPLGPSTDETEALCDGPVTYQLPEGYRVGETTMNEPAIFDGRGAYCHVEVDEATGRPELISDRFVVLAKVEG